jgi:hypothetical protein
MLFQQLVNKISLQQTCSKRKINIYRALKHAFPLACFTRVVTKKRANVKAPRYWAREVTRWLISCLHFGKETWGSYCRFDSLWFKYFTRDGWLDKASFIDVDNIFEHGKIPVLYGFNCFFFPLTYDEQLRAKWWSVFLPGMTMRI